MESESGGTGTPTRRGSIGGAVAVDQFGDVRSPPSEALHEHPEITLSLSETHELRKALELEKRRAAELQVKLMQMELQQSGFRGSNRKRSLHPEREMTGGTAITDEGDDRSISPSSHKQVSSPGGLLTARETDGMTSYQGDIYAQHSLHSGTDDSAAIEAQLVAALPAVPGFGVEGFVPSFLSAAEQLLGVEDVLPGVSAWVDRRRNAAHGHTKKGAGYAGPAAQGQQFKFGDGIEGVRPFGVVKKKLLYTKEYQPPTDVWGMVDGLARWCTPKGLAWPARAVEDLTRNCKVAASRQGTLVGDERSDRVHVPLYVYTSALYHRPLWAIWIAAQQQWKDIPRGHLIESVWERSEGARENIKLDRDAAADVASLVGCYLEDVSSALFPLQPLPHGLSAFQVHVKQRERGKSMQNKNQDAASATASSSGGMRQAVVVIRYAAGKGELSPLADSVAWLPSAEEALGGGFWSVTQGRLPPSGILEYLESRPQKDVYEGAGWSVVPISEDTHDALVKDCFAEPNQNRYNSELHERLAILLEQMPTHGSAAARRKAMEAKLDPDEGRPVPQTIAHALELQELRYRGSSLVIALSGLPRVLVDEASLLMTSVFRIYREHDEQPYLLLNSTMRAFQEGNSGAWLDVSARAGSAVCGRYEARLPVGSELRHVDDPHRTVRWDPVIRCWICGLSTRLNTADTSMHLGTWLLDDLRPMMFYLEKALQDIPGEETTVKSYRGLADAMLPRELYHAGALVVWGSFSSSSADQGTATWFATQGGSAAVFTLRGRSCRMIAPWSRFAREMEMLYPANCCFQVKTMLTEDQQQILGREELQLYEVDEVDEVEALTIFVTGHINAAITRDEGFSKVSQLVGIIQPLLSKDLGSALEHAVRPDRPFILESEGVEMCQRLVELAELADPPIDVEDILNRAIITAARDGHSRALPQLKEVGGSEMATDEGGLSVLEVAMRSGHTDCARNLLSLGAPRSLIEEAQDESGATMLHRMAASGELQAVSVLLALGANPAVKDSQHRTPAMCAYERGHKGIVRLLNPEETLPATLLEDYWAATHWKSDHGESRTRFGEGVLDVRMFGSLTQKRPEFWDSNYVPPNVWDMVCDLVSWETPLGLPWSERAVDDLVANCRLMDAKHSQGKDADVVVPLYTYTSSLYRSEIWVVWHAEGEKQMVSGGWGVHSKPQVFIASRESESAGAAGTLTISPRMLCGPDSGTDSRRGDEACFVCGRTAPLDGSERVNEGQLQQCSHQNAEHCVLAGTWEHLEKVRMPCIGIGKNIVGYGWANGQCVIRYTSTPEDGPLRGCTAWLPPPDVLFGDGPHRVGSFPHSSVLEYIFSRPPGSVLEQRSMRSASTAWKCRSAVTSPAAQGVLEDCEQQRNQHHYDQSLHKRFEAVLSKLAATGPLLQQRPTRLSTPTKESSGLSSDTSDRYEVSQEVLQHAVEQKLRGRRRPTPEAMQHALALQILEEKGSRRWILGLSGEPKLVVHDESLISCRAYRACSPYAPGPAEHANAAVRSLRAGVTGLTLDVSPSQQMYSAYGGRYVDIETFNADRNLIADELEESGRESAQRTSRTGFKRTESEGDWKAGTPVHRVHTAASGSWAIGTGLGGAPPTSPHDTNSPQHMMPPRHNSNSITGSGSPRSMHSAGGVVRVSTWGRSPPLMPPPGPTFGGKSVGRAILKRVQQPHHAIRWEPSDEVWVVVPETLRYGSWASKRFPNVTLEPNEVTFGMGTWMLQHCQALLFYVYHALNKLPWASGPRLCFRASLKFAAGLPFQTNQVVYWESVIAGSSSRSIALSHLSGHDGSLTVFRMNTRSARYIAPWSRLAREGEVAIPAQACLQVMDVFEEPRSGVMMCDLAEIDDAAALVLFIREATKRPPPGESAPAFVTQLYRVITAVESGSLSQALAITLRPEKPVIHSPAGVEIAFRCLALGADAALIAVALREAARDGLSKSVSVLLQLGGDPECPDEKGDTPLELALTGGHVDTVRELVNGHIHNLVNVTDPAEPPLHRRATRGQPLAIFTLLTLGVNVAEKDLSGKTAMHCAHLADKTFCVYVLKHGAPEYFPPELEKEYPDTVHAALSAAVAQADLDAVIAFSHLGADPTAGAAGGHTALHTAARQDVFNQGLGLIAFRHMTVSARNAHAARDSARQTPLHEAAENGHAAAAAVLLQAGADPHALDCLGNTPLALASGDDVSHLLRKAMDQALADAARRLQILPLDVLQALDRMAETIADAVLGIAASDVARIGFGGTLRAVRNLILLREQNTRESTSGQCVGALGDGQLVPLGAMTARPSMPSNMEMYIDAEEFKVRFVSWGPPDETDAMLMERIHSWLGNMGVLDGLNAVRWWENREDAGRAQLIVDEMDARRNLHAKIHHRRQVLRKRSEPSKAGEKGGHLAGSGISTPAQRRKERVERFWKPWKPYWSIIYIASLCHLGVVLPLGLAFDEDGNETITLIADFVFWTQVVITLLSYNWLEERDGGPNIKVLGRLASPLSRAKNKNGTNKNEPENCVTSVLQLFCNHKVQQDSFVRLGIDLVAALPLNNLTASHPLLRLNKACGLYFFREKIVCLEESWLAALNPAHLLLMYSSYVITYILHVGSCFYVGLVRREGGIRTALMADYATPCGEGSKAESYPACFLTVLSLMTGFRASWPGQGLSDEEVLALFCFAFVGVLCVAWYVSAVIKLLDLWSLRGKEFADAVNSVSDWLEHAGADGELKRDVERYVRFLWRTERGTRVRYFDFVVQDLLVHAPRLARDLRLALDEAILREVPFFANLETDTNFMHEVISSLQLHLGVPGSVLCEEGAAATCMFFIASGVVEIYVDGYLAQGEYREGRRVATLTAGDYFGEVALLQETARSASAVSLTDTRMYVLERGHAFDRIRKYPGAFAALLDAMSRRKRSLEAIKQRRQGQPWGLLKRWSLRRKEDGTTSSPDSPTQGASTSEASPPTVIQVTRSRTTLRTDSSSDTDRSHPGVTRNRSGMDSARIDHFIRAHQDRHHSVSSLQDDDDIEDVPLGHQTYSLNKSSSKLGSMDNPLTGGRFTSGSMIGLQHRTSPVLTTETFGALASNQRERALDVTSLLTTETFG
eukprot:Hpha_TRINITY_DN14525_c0_g1::TRINITY_DN14525_c0_g1_i1::g.47200::m.47200